MIAQHAKAVVLALLSMISFVANAQSMTMDHGASTMQGGSAPADARDPNAYADGVASRMIPGMDMADDGARAYLLLDRFELFSGRRHHGQALDAQGWYGGDLDKLWLKVDGERSDGHLGATRTEVLWNRAIASYWGLQVGVRHDFGDGPGRNWAAIGVQGIAPWWFDIEATAYVGERGRTALRFEASRDVLLMQRLVLQPNLKVDVYGKQDRERALGAGLSHVEAALRMRYEWSRKFAPYVGVVVSRSFAGTASDARAAGERVSDVRVVGGVRIWF